MIQPSSIWGASDVAKSFKALLCYYVTASAVAALNFLPLFYQPESPQQIVLPRTTYLLVACSMLSAPLLLEYVVDVVIWFASTASVKQSEPRLGNFIMLLSLFLPVAITKGTLENVSCPYNALFVNCFVSFLQSLILVALYRKLQDRHWTSTGSLICITFYVGSQLGSSFAIVYNVDEKSEYGSSSTVSLALYFAFGALCAACHRVWCKQYVVEYLLAYWRSKPPPAWDTNDYVFIALQFITSLYFIVNFLTSMVFLINRYDSQYFINTDIITHIVLGMMACILPGRMVRKNLIVLNERMVNKDTFIRYVSHEIRSPLATTSLGLKYLLDKLSVKSIALPEVRDVVQESLVTCELALNTLNDFLMLDKIQSSNILDVSATVCQASDFLVDAVRPFSLQAEANNMSLVCNVESLDGVTCPDIAIKIDVYKMNLVLRNLLSNALKFTPAEGRVTVTMTMSEFNAEESQTVNTSKKYLDGTCSMVRIAVTDTGCGIHKANLPKLFGQYVQFDADKLQGGKGSGLGLWLSKAIVEMHGGRIGATSEGIGKGCTFWFELPCELSLEDRASVAALCEHTGPSNRGSSFLSRNFSTIHHEATGASGVGHTPSSLRPPAIEIPGNVGGVVVYDLESGRVGSGDVDTATPTVRMGEKHSTRKFLDVQIEVAANAKTRNRTHSFSPRHFKRSPGVVPIAQVPTVNSNATMPMTPLKVLLVDDSVIARKMVERSLRAIDAVCHHANTGKEAVEKTAISLQCDEPYDVILIDHYMPEMNGPEAVQLIRLKGFVGIIFGVSGMSCDADFEQLVESGKMNRIMMKPFNLDLFLDYMKDYETCPVDFSK